MSATEGQAAHREQVRALIAVLIREVLWPFRWHVLLILLMQVATQALLLASLVLPWQLLQVLMTGQSRLTGWVPGSYSDNDKIAMLLALALLCYCSYALLQWLIRRAISSLSSTILRTLNKTRLVTNHRQLGRRVLAVVLGTLSSLCIALLFCLVIALLHPLLALLAAGCVIGIGMIVMRYYRYEKVPLIQEALQRNVLTVINISFALGFSILVVDYLYGSVRPLFTLFVLLIAMRQMMAASLNGLVNFLGVIKNFQHINMLLLPRSCQVLLLEASDFVKRFDAAKLAQWLPAWLAERHHCHPDILECRLMHGRAVAQVLLRVHNESKTSPYWLLKCYVLSRENEVIHETALLGELGSSNKSARLAVPVLLDHGRLPWCAYVLLEVGSQLPQWLNSEERKPWMVPLRQALMQVSLSHDLATQYRATFASLSERMKNVNVTHFDYLTRVDRQTFQIELFTQRWPQMIAAVERVPQCLTIHNPSSARLAMMETYPLLLDWHGWSHDAFGAHWPLSAKLHAEILDILTSQWPGLCARQEWAALKSPVIAAHYVALAARAHEFCHRCQASNDAGALNMITGLLKAHDALPTVV